ncbi:serine/threonine-protein kinase LMTK3 [Prunus avium]|uniref:Serine/threonine-protein kinase LMTK3 n=1 Tax=Prunus avium TaxID=42229 RepID=A0A6P5SVU5_PRUAV|nr:serine/threonine-protein kinase LMTK3 [Prunus avium]
MRGGTAIGIGRKLTNPSSLSISKQTLIPFSTSSNSGGGRGRGRGGPFPPTPARFDFTPPPRVPGQPDSDDPKPEPPPSAPGLGHGRGKPLPTFSSFVSAIKPNSGAGRGQPGQAQSIPESRDPVAPDAGPSKPIKPIFFVRGDGSDPALPGSGRGKPMNFTRPEVQVKEENRHIQARPEPDPDQPRTRPRGPKLTREEAVKQALGILAQDGAEGDDVGGGGGGGGDRGRGRGRGMRGRGRGDSRMSERGDRRRGKDSDDSYASGLYLGDNADGEKLAKKLGPEIMNKLVEGFEEMSSEVLPSPLDDAYVDAMHTNFMIECEPEYLMGEFNKNPDIDEKPPISLRDALEKMKPFLMAYENIQSQEEWEEVVNETMERVPLLKEIVDHYSGPDRVTARKQQEELERVAKTLPAKVPDSVKRFTDRAVLSLQSNPGWGFDRKCQFMDKLVAKVSQHYN